MSNSAGLNSRSPPRPPSSSSSSAMALSPLQLAAEAELPPPPPPPSQNSIAIWPSEPLPPPLPLSRLSSSSSSSSYFSTELLPPPPPPPPLLTLEPLRRVASPSSSPSPSFSTELLLPPPPLPLLTLPPQPLRRVPSVVIVIIVLLHRAAAGSSSTAVPLSPNSATWDYYIISSTEDAPEQPPSCLDYFGISTDPDTPPHTGGLQTSPRPPPSSIYDSFVSGHRGGGSSQAASSESIAALATVTVSDATVVCAVCTDALQLASTPSRLPCGHVYHSHCIVQWLSLRNSCPVCRRSIPMFPAASTTEDTAPSPPPTETDQEIAPSSPPFDPAPTAATDHRRRSLPGARRIRRICRELLNYMEMSRPRQQTD